MIKAGSLRAETESTLKRFVTFYITNFPPHASTFFLRKGFEVCGILEDVFVANNRNRNGEVYGFVQYAKVRNMNKLLKALNNVCFGQYCIRAMLARFDRKDAKNGDLVRKGEGVRGKVVGKECGEGPGKGSKVRKEENEGEKRERMKEGGKEGKVSVGSVTMRVRGAGKTGGDGMEGVHGRAKVKEGREASIDKLNMTTKLVRVTP